MVKDWSDFQWLLCMPVGFSEKLFTAWPPPHKTTPPHLQTATNQTYLKTRHDPA
jgi:hypothetical protein